MAKFNGFEKYLLVQGLERVALEMKADIRDLEERGKNPLMTVGYVEMVVKETLDKLSALTLKQKQMAERDFRGTWKGREGKVKKTSSPIIGMVYEGVDKFFGGQVVGVLIQLHQENDEAVLQMKGNSLVSVDKKTLKIVVSS